MTEIDATTRYEKRFVEVRGRRMGYVETGDGDPVVFLHGNATSSYMWRNIMPHMEGLGRLIAIDNIGQGDSDKLAPSGPQSYAIAEHQTYIDGALAALGVADRVTFVMHDWGGTMGIDWARRHPASVRGLAHCEIVVINHPSYDDYGPVADLLKRLRGPEGEQLVLEENFFVERVFTAGVMRELDEATMTQMRRPYLEPGEARRATLSWVRQIPIEGRPEEIVAVTEANHRWLAGTETPKLFIHVDPGQIIFDIDLERIRSWHNQTEIVVAGLHHPQEDSPHQIGEGLADWYRKIPYTNPQ